MVGKLNTDNPLGDAREVYDEAVRLEADFWLETNVGTLRLNDADSKIYVDEVSGGKIALDTAPIDSDGTGVLAPMTADQARHMARILRRAAQYAERQSQS